MALTLESPVKKIKGVGSKYEKILEEKGIRTVYDLLLNFPLNYIDFTYTPGIDLEENKLYYLEVVHHSFFKLPGRQLSITKVNGRITAPPTGPNAHQLSPQDNQGPVTVQVTFFNRPYLINYLRKLNTRYICIYGKLFLQSPGRKGNHISRGNDSKDKEPSSSTTCTYKADNPMFFPVPEGKSDGVVAFYRKIGNIKPGILRKIIKNAFLQLNDDYEPLPGNIPAKYKFLPLVKTLQRIHQPKKIDPRAIEQLTYRFIYEEFLYFQLEIQITRNLYTKVRRVNPYVFDAHFHQAARKNLEFELTPDQDAAFHDILKDLTGEYAMQRLLQGDVGSGKTIVAFMAMFAAQANGYQAAMLAPTEILAQQHYQASKRFFKSSRVEILTGSTPATARKDILARLAAGEIDILFGTHAILNEKVTFNHLSLVVIDEQHRFGVAQRAALYYKGNHTDILVTTATPIPRTMLLSLYDDLTVSVIKTKPRGRLPIITKIIAARRREEFYQWLKNNVMRGVKVYIILPLVEASEFFTGLKSIEEESVYFAELFGDLPIGIVSGRLPAAEKEAILNNFASGEIRVLVSTTVIEVGIDVKDAAIIVIEDADRYGLSQLHQLRGRVGRGDLQSYCFLIPSTSISENGKQRLRTIESEDDGFKIAETDLEMRGGGVISGLEQSGNMDFRFGDIKRDYRILKAARYDATLILEGTAPRNYRIDRFIKDVESRVQGINFS